MEHTESIAPPMNATRRRWGHAAVALATTVGLYAAPFAYFLTACSSSDLSDRLQWVGLMAVFVPVLFPGYVALAAIVVFALVFGASQSDGFARIRHIAIPGALAAIAVGALVVGAVAPTRCSIF